MTGRSSKESAISSLERSRNATELLVKKQNVRYPSSRETTELEHLGPGAEPEPLAVVLHDGPVWRLRISVKPLFESLLAFGSSESRSEGAAVARLGLAHSIGTNFTGETDSPPERRDSNP